MRHVILHGHIFKNAGTTFDWSLQRCFAEGFLDHRDDQSMRRHGSVHLQQLLEAQPALQAISSHHMTSQLPSMQDVRFHQVSLLRHPLTRLRSVYEFERRQAGETPGSIAAREKSFHDYVAWRMLPEVAPTIRNYQTRYLAGYHQLVDDSALPIRYFSAALSTLSGESPVGIVERYDESMVLLEEQLRQHFAGIDLAYVAQNVAVSSSGNDRADEDVARSLDALGNLQKIVIDTNSYDLALYHLAIEHLQRRIDATDNFDTKLSDFCMRCQRLRDQSESQAS